MQVKRTGKVILYVLMTVALAALFTICLLYTNNYPKGSDVYGHLFKTNVLYHAILDGEWYPVYTPFWYNGIELFRYWPPLSYYVLAAFQFICNGNILIAYTIFGGFCYFLSMMGWMGFGLREKRLSFCFIAGTLYFLFPDSLRVFFSEGNVPRIFISALLPLLFFCMWEFIEYKNKKAIIPFTVILCAITFTHIMISAMTGISLFLFCLIHAISHKTWKYQAALIGGALLSYPAMGIVLLPGLLGGLTGQSSEASVQTIGNWAQKASLSLNPLYRLESMDYFYFGISIFLIIILGLIAANKKMVSGFLAALCIFISTTTAFTAFIKLLPMSQVWWMQRFVPMALCFFLISLIVWKQLKKTVLFVFVACMIIDIAPSVYGFLGYRSADVLTLQETTADNNLLTEAAAITKNRVAILDNSMMGSYPSYYFSKNMNEASVPYSFGWAYQGAATIRNIVSINEAIEFGFPEYAFDRLVELGNDVVILSKQHVDIKEEDWEEVMQAASDCGYVMVNENEANMIFRLENVPEDSRFGTVTVYDHLAIGEEAQYICYMFPNFQYGQSNCIEDYTLEQLCRYDKIYLSGFTYNNKEQAESLLAEAAAKGVKIYIDMQHIPINKLTGKTEFLGVYAQFIQFTERFPILENNNGSQFKLDFKTPGYDLWNTVYISGLQNVQKATEYGTRTNLAYWGYDENPNISFIGFNPIYYYINTKNSDLLIFLQEMLGETAGKLPERTMVPLEVTYDYDEIRIRSWQDNVNTNIAALECFVPNRILNKDGNLFVVGEGETILHVEYTHKQLGILVSIAGCVALIIYIIFMFVWLGERKDSEA